MPFYRDVETFYEVMNDLFSQVMARPDLLKPLRDGKVVLRITTTGPDAILVVDGRAVPPRFTTGTDATGKVDVGLSLPADVLHNVWMGKIRLRDAYMAGKMHLDSNPLKALSLMTSLLEMFRFVEGLYPGVLKKRGLL
jgi:putative sterol carrier protein